MEALSSNKELADQLTAASNPDQAIKIAEADGDTSSQELQEAYKTKLAVMSSDELANVTGGKDGNKKTDGSSESVQGNLSSD
jgi:hypothetical protein